jgi:hypothetical protein
LVFNLLGEVRGLSEIKLDEFLHRRLGQTHLANV